MNRCAPFPPHFLRVAASSNNQVDWVLAVVQRIWLQGHLADGAPNTWDGYWDGFTYAVGLSDPTQMFRYASIIHGGSSALINDGDENINGCWAYVVISRQNRSRFCLLD